MNQPLQITFKNMETSEHAESVIREKVTELEKYCDRIVSCHVTVEAPHRSHRKGTHFKVGIDLTVPGHELVVSKDPGDEKKHEDLYIAIRDSFKAARRELIAYNDRLHTHR